MARFTAGAPTGAALQQLEPLLRAAVFKPANAIVGLLLQQAVDRVDAGYQPKPGEFRKQRVCLTVDCLFGSFEIQRDYYYNVRRKRGHYPADSALGLENGLTPGLARLVCLEGADTAGFDLAARHLAETGGIRIGARQIQRLVQRIGPEAQRWQEREATPGSTDAEVLYVSGDGTGVPMRREELEGRKGKADDGKARTRQAYLGCVFTQHTRDEKGRPVRDAHSTTYTSSFAPIDEFGPQLRREALRRGMGAARQTVLLIDGANGLENMGLKCFAGATQIVDFFHAMEHAGEVVSALLGPTHPEHKKRRRHWAKRLLKDGVEALIAAARKEGSGTAAEPAVEQALGYFVRNVERMQYGTFRSKGYFIGSGVVEAGCKAVIGARCKQSGMRWSVAGADNVLALRCIHHSGRTDEYWKHHLNARAAENDQLHLTA